MRVILGKGLIVEMVKELEDGAVAEDHVYIQYVIHVVPGLAYTLCPIIGFTLLPVTGKLASSANARLRWDEWNEN